MNIGIHAGVSGPARQHVVALAAFAASLGVANVAHAVQFDTGNPDLSVRWDNTVKYSAAVRVKEQSSTLTSNPNLNDGDENFDRGLISNRLDLLSEFDVKYQQVGLRISGAAWYDALYNQRNDHPDDGTASQLSADYDEFTHATRRIHGRDGEILDAFVFGHFDLGDIAGNVRLGNHSLVWGESLFFGANAIAGGMMPVDVAKLTSVPNTQFKEAIRPVAMLSGELQFSPSVSLGAYYQFHWEANRLPAVGSYFSQVDTSPEGAEQILLGDPFVNGAQRVDSLDAKNAGQGGIRLSIRGEETDYGLYAIRFHDKTHQQVSNIGFAATTIPNILGLGANNPCVLAGGNPGINPAVCYLAAPTSYRLAYHEGITAFGASANHTFGDVNVGIEASIRHNQDLASTNGADTSALGGSTTNNSNRPAYAVGKTAHVNVSALWSIPRTFLFNEANFVGEIMWNRVLSVTKNRDALDPNATRDATALRLIFEPVYRQVSPGLDLSVPIGLGFSPGGSRSMALGPGVLPADGGGDFSVGLNGTYLDRWRFSLSYTHYFGEEKPFLDAQNHYTYGQSLKDRDFIAASVRRTF